MPLKEDHQIRHTPVIDIRVGMAEQPVPLPRINGIVRRHVFMNFFLQVHSQGAVRTNDFIRTHSCVGAHIAARIGNANISRVVTYAMMRALDRGRHQSAQEFLV